MKRMNFDSRGRLTFVDGKLTSFNKGPSTDSDSDDYENLGPLKTSDSLAFLKEEKKINEIRDTSNWGLYQDGKKLTPLKFSNGKTQEDIVSEVVSAIKEGTKVIFLHGVCGTGKSAIALNIARALGRASVVVPIKSLQRQYEEDYLEKKYILKPNGRTMKIAMITGRENHDSIINPGVSCADPFLPDTIKITDKNFDKIAAYYKNNPLASNTSVPMIDEIKRMSIAPANPYWSPILPADFDLQTLKDAKKKKYLGLGGREFIFYHRKPGCSYYDQYLAYIEADVIIFNAAKYKIESTMGRKPSSDIEIFDEADEFLDNLSDQVELNLNHLTSSLRSIQTSSPSVKETIDKIMELIDLEQKNKRILGVKEGDVFPISETKMEKILTSFKDAELEVEISVDELNYANKALEASKTFDGQYKDLYVTFRKKDQDLYVTLVTTDLSKKIQEIVDKNKAVLFMSGTLHSEKVIKNIFGIKEFKTIVAEAINQGSVEIHKTGKEFDCSYANFSSGRRTREDYLRSLEESIKKAKRPTLVHVNAFEDLPTEEEVRYLGLNILPREKLIYFQNEDKAGQRVSLFKKGVTDILYTTKCSRGIDFPGQTCNSVVLTKYPNPNINSTFWKILKKTYPDYFWDFYKDKAKREFLQRIYRAVRSLNDHVYVLSPDSRVLDAVIEIQKSNS